MATYIKNQDPWKAEKWTGHNKPFAFDVPVTKKEGISGYGSKLGYFEDHDKRMQTIRPNEYLTVSPNGKVAAMNHEFFENEFVLANPAKPVNNVAKKTKKDTG